MNLTLTVYFTPEEWRLFMKPIVGNGGGQIFVRKCQAKACKQHRALSLTGEDVNRWFRYRDNYGSGGFQQRMGRSGLLTRAA